MSNGVKIVFGLNIVYLLIASIEIYFLTIPISLPISLLIYYIIINSSKKPNTLEDNISTIEEKSHKQNENSTDSNALRLLIGSLLAPIILLIIQPIIYFIFESKGSHGDFISFDGIETMIILIILYPFLTYFIYRILPKKILPKLTHLQKALLIIFIITVLFLLLLILYSE